MLSDNTQSISTRKNADEDAISFIQVLSIALSRVAVYGNGHPAARVAVEEALDACKKVIGDGSGIELGCKEQQFLVNSEIIPQQIGERLATTFEQRGLSTMVLKSPLKDEDFWTFISLLSMAPKDLDAKGGFNAVAAAANMQSVQISTAKYVRMEDGNTVDSENVTTEIPFETVRTGASATGRTKRLHKEIHSAVVNIDNMDLSKLSLEDALSGLSDQPVVTNPVKNNPQKRRERNDFDDQSYDLGGSGNGSMTDEEVAEMRKMLGELRLISKLVGIDEDSGSEKDIPSLNDVHLGMQNAAARVRANVKAFFADFAENSRQLSEIEDDAKKRGVSLKMTHEKMLYRLAELVQETMQPLSVANGVVDMLLHGQLGTITENQKEMVGLASESIELVNALATHIKELVGNPSYLHPDRIVISEAYQTQGIKVIHGFDDQILHTPSEKIILH